MICVCRTIDCEGAVTVATVTYSNEYISVPSGREDWNLLWIPIEEKSHTDCGNVEDTMCSDRNIRRAYEVSWNKLGAQQQFLERQDLWSIYWDNLVQQEVELYMLKLPSEEENRRNAQQGRCISININIADSLQLHKSHADGHTAGFQHFHI